MSDNARNIDRLLALTERLTRALNDDIAALERGRPREMRSPTAEVQQMTALYTREAAQFPPSALNALPKEARDRLAEITARFRSVLVRHGRVLTRVRSCTEGMIRAIADDVAKKRNAQRPYSPAPAQKFRPPGPILYNKVV